jgi:hypothetical protein
VTCAATDALLRGAASKARGGLQKLVVSGRPAITHDALLAVVTANAGALRTLRGTSLTRRTAGEVEALVRAAPQLRAFYTHVDCHYDVRQAYCMLRNRAPFRALHLRSLAVNGRIQAAGEGSAPLLVALAAGIAAHPSLSQLQLHRAALNTPAALDALVDAGLAASLTGLGLEGCMLSAASAPALARLLSSRALTTLRIGNRNQQLLDAPAAAVLSAALRANNATLTSLSFSRVNFWHDPDGAATLLDALAGHRTLRSLKLSGNAVRVADQAAVGSALGALIIAALTELLALDDLGEAGLRPLLAALPSSTRLRTLALHPAAGRVSDAFAAAVLLPAVHANASLRALRFDADDGAAALVTALVHEAQASVADREEEML